MKARSLKFGTQVKVTWEDSAAQPGWQPATAGVTATVLTLGYIVATDAKALTVTHSVDTDGSVCGALAIPWSAIRTLAVLK